MPYSEGRIVHDADAHIMEWPTWLVDYAEPGVRGQLAPRPPDDGSGQLIDVERVRAKHASDDYRAVEAEEIMARKNFAATGGFIAEDRPRALDLLGFASQLLFNTFHNGRFAAMERSDPELIYGAARAHNRGMIDFCSVDERLLPTCYVPLADFGRSAAMARQAVDEGAAALLVPSAAPSITRRATSGSIRCGPPPRKPASRSCSMSAAGESCSTRRTSATDCPSRPTSTAARRTSVRSTTWPSRARPCRPSPP